MTASPARVRGALGVPLLVIALAGLAIATYLLAVRLLGEPPVCGPVRGCETVTTSEYSEVLGIPVAAFGVLYALVVSVASWTWWRRADRRALLVAYASALPGTLAVAYLTYVELFVIHAVCAWCASFAVTVVLGLLSAGLALRRG